MARGRLLVCLLVVAGCTGPLPGSTTGSTTRSAAADASHPTRPSQTAAGPSSGPTASTDPLTSASPAPSPDPAALDLEVTSCPGGVVLHWTVSRHPDFHHYSALRSPEREVDPAWPPIAPAVDWGDTYTSDRFVTSAIDSSVIPSEAIWYYRVVAYDAANRVLAASPVRHAVLHEVVDLGPLRAEPTAEGPMHLTWTPYRGRGSCFSQYRVLAGSSGPSSVIAVISAPDAAELVTGALHPGTTYQLRVEAVRTTTLGSFVVGTSEVLTVSVP